MPSLHELQAGFARAILDPAALGIADRVMPAGIPAGARLGIYRNNVLYSLQRVLAGNYPATRRLMGAEAFDPLAQAFALGHLPERPQLLAWGAGFPGFVAAEVPDRPWLGDLAALENAREEAYDAPDGTPLQASDLATVPPECYPALRLALQPSLRLIASAWPIWTLWNAANAGEPPEQIEPEPQAVLVVRPEWHVLTSLISPGEHALLAALASGASLGEAAAASLDAEPGLDLQTVLAQHIAAGIFTGFS